MLPDAAMVIFVVQNHREAVLRLGVLRAHMRRGPLGGGHQPKSLRADQILVLDGLPQLQQIPDGAAEAQVRVVGHVVLIRGDIASRKTAVRMGKAVYQGEIVAIGGGLHARRLEDVLLDVVRETLAGNPLDNRDQQLKAGDGPVPFRSRVIHPFFPGVQGHHFIQRLWLAAGCFNGIAEIVIIDDAGSVIEQLSNRDVMTLEGELRNELGDIVIERQFAPFDQLHDGNSGEGQHGTDHVIDGFIFSRRFEAKVCVTKSLVQEYPAAARHDHGGTHDVFLRHDLLHDGIEIGARVCCRRANRSGGVEKKQGKENFS